MTIGELVIPRDLSQCSLDEVDELAVMMGRMCGQLAVFDDDDESRAEGYADGLIAGAAVMARAIRKSHVQFRENEDAARGN